MGEGAEDLVNAKELNMETREMVASIKMDIANSNNAVIEELLEQRNSIDKVDKRMERLEHVVIGINGDPNSRGIVHRCEDHETRFKKYDDLIEQIKIKSARQFGIFIIAIIGAVSSSTVLQTVVEYLVNKGG